MKHQVLTPGSKKKLLEQIDALRRFVESDADRDTIQFRVAELIAPVCNQFAYYIPKTQKDTPTMFRYNVPVEYGPTAADVTHFFIDALCRKDAVKRALQCFETQFPHRHGMVAQGNVQKVKKHA